MRRLVAIPVKTSVVIALLLVGAVYVAAEAREAVLRRQQQELAKIENSAVPSQQSTFSQSTGISDAITPVSPAPQQTPSATSTSSSDEVVAERQASQLPAQKPAVKSGGHTRQIVISIPDRRLALLEDGQIVKIYPIAVGARGTPSPEGDFQVINHAKNPTYRHNGKEIAPGKDNPLGSRWMGLSLKGYGIHGTNVPSSIGKAASHGCFRMAKNEVEDLYSRVQVGDAVTIHRQRDELIAQVFEPASAGNAPVLAAKTPNNSELQVASASAASPASTETQQ